MDVVQLAAAAAWLCSRYYNYLKIHERKKIRKQWKKRRWWMTAIHQNRTHESMNAQLVDLMCEPSGEFKNFTRMSFSDFEYLLNKISPSISKQDTQLRKSIPAKVRLAVTLRYLATGDSFKSLHFLFKISSQLISEIIPEVCTALVEALKDEIKIPSTPEAWLQIENGFKRFPRCCGAISGKHIVIQCPPNTCSQYYNYKGTFSIVLLGLVDGNFNFIFADVGDEGRISDSGIFTNSLLWAKICSQEINFPNPHPLPGLSKNVPYVLLGDETFALSTHVMKPYPGNHEIGTPERTFNQKLSSSRVVVENAFGLLASRFRVFRKPMLPNPQKARDITMTCALLHNFLRRSSTSSQLYTPVGSTDLYNEDGVLVQPGSWRLEIPNTGAIRNLAHVPQRSANNAKQVRDEFTKYFYNQYIL